MPSPLSGPGVNLPLPQNLYPSELQNAPYDASSNRLGLAPGQSWVIPAGTWYIGLSQYLVLQFLDPVTGVWSMGAGAAWTGSYYYVKSDGFNARVANLTGCPVSASVTSYGSAYVQASTTIAVTGGGGSLWQPIIGGQLGTVSTFSLNVTNAGAGYGVAPILLIPPPPPAANNANGVGGVPASGYVTISGGTITGITLTNPGAGYPSAPPAVLVTNPFDPNISTGITQGAVAFSLTGSGSLTAVLCTNNGAPLANPANITLTVSGAGTQATAVANVLQTIITASLSGTGTGYGPVAGITTSGGGPNRGTITNNPDFLNLAFRPRPAQISLAVVGSNSLAAQTGTILDGGLFLSAPGAVVVAQPLGSVVATTIALTMGSVADIATVQPAP